MPSKNEAVQLVNSVRSSTDRNNAGDLTLNETLEALEIGDVFDVEFWNSIEYAKAVLKVLAEKVRRLEDT